MDGSQIGGTGVAAAHAAQRTPHLDPQTPTRASPSARLASSAPRGSPAIAAPTPLGAGGEASSHGEASLFTRASAAARSLITPRRVTPRSYVQLLDDDELQRSRAEAESREAELSRRILTLDTARPARDSYSHPHPHPHSHPWAAAHDEDEEEEWLMLGLAAGDDETADAATAAALSSAAPPWRASALVPPSTADELLVDGVPRADLECVPPSRAATRGWRCRRRRSQC